MSGRSGLATRLDAADLVLPAFTDEELASLRPSTVRTLVPEATLADLDGPAREAALAAARRTLVAQHHLVADRDGRLRPTGALLLVDHLRARPTGILVATRRSGDRTERRWYYALAALAALEERLDATMPGVHRFTLRSVARTGHDVARACTASTRTVTSMSFVGTGRVQSLSVRCGTGGRLSVDSFDGERRLESVLDHDGLAAAIASMLGQTSQRSKSS
jgi:hypothetical protein